MGMWEVPSSSPIRDKNLPIQKKEKKLQYALINNFQTTQFNKASITTTTWGHLQINFVFMDSI